MEGKKSEVIWYRMKCDYSIYLQYFIFDYSGKVNDIFKF